MTPKFSVGDVVKTVRRIKFPKRFITPKMTLKVVKCRNHYFYDNVIVYECRIFDGIRVRGKNYGFDECDLISLDN